MPNPTQVSEPTLDLPTKVAHLEAWQAEEARRHVPTSAIWSLVVTIAVSAVSAVWMASATYHEVAALRATINKWEPKIEEVTKMIPLQTQVQELQRQVQDLQVQAAAKR